MEALESGFLRCINVRSKLPDENKQLIRRGDLLGELPVEAKVYLSSNNPKKDDYSHQTSWMKLCCHAAAVICHFRKSAVYWSTGVR